MISRCARARRELDWAEVSNEFAASKSVGLRQREQILDDEELFFVIVNTTFQRRLTLYFTETFNMSNNFISRRNLIQLGAGAGAALLASHVLPAWAQTPANQLATFPNMATFRNPLFAG